MLAVSGNRERAFIDSTWKADHMAAPSAFQLTFLDMGRTKFGDCLLLQAGDQTVLIDGGHSGDTVAANGSASIPQQLEALCGAPAPWNVNLLVVTHCHSDHIGCLPKLIREGSITADHALVADEGFGWGHISPDFGADSLVSLPETTRRLLGALREEPRDDLRTDREIAEFLDQVDRQEQEYQQMLQALQDAGTSVVRFGRDDHTALVAAFAPLGMKILGPTPLHLLTCAQSVTSDSIQLVKRIEDSLAQDASLDGLHDDEREVSLFRGLSSSSDAEADISRLGAALNNQSIVLQFTIAGQKLLLTGDMQFAEPDVPDLDPLMTALRAVIAAEAPFDFYKIGHHGSHNAFDQSVIDELAGTVNFGISGGWNDSGHPATSVLTLLKNHRDDWLWLRTDKNGQYRIFGDSTGVTVSQDKGDWNNFRRNLEDSTAGRETPPRSPLVSPSALVQPLPAVPPAVPLVSGREDFVEVHAKVPHVSTKVTITIQVDPSSRASGDVGTQTPVTPLPTDLRIAPGRSLPNLLVVTDRDRLAANIGAEAADRVIAGFRGLGKTVLDRLPTGAASATIQVVRQQLRQPGANYQGVLLIGGYDVVPSQIFDALSPTVRSQATGFHDDDQFIIWSDWGYGCTDGDDEPEIPVSRIPDGRSAQAVFGALAATLPPARERFGLRNIKRPYADEVFQNVRGTRTMLTSRPTRSGNLPAGSVRDSEHLYFMLHGSYVDTATFSGEDDGDYPAAFELRDVPESLTGVVFTGCCWGAAGVRQRARDVLQGDALRPVTANDSLAVRLLQSGVCGFVGCTGSHYSPTGKAMHEEFWKAIADGLAPAPALFRARTRYLNTFHDTSLGDLPLKLKIFHQYTCLGVGW